MSTAVDEDERNDVEERAAATLQAATRRMFARKSFANLHKQTLASITIQRNLVRWWTRHHEVNQGNGDTINNNVEDPDLQSTPLTKTTSAMDVV